MNLIRYEKDNPGYVKSNWKKLIIRPFLTPTPGVEFEDDQHETKIQHTNFTEIIRKVDINQDTTYKFHRDNKESRYNGAGILSK